VDGLADRGTQAREAPARAEADRLRSRVEELAEELARAEEQVARLVIAREEVTRVLEEHAAAEPPSGPAGKPAGEPRPASPIGAVTVPPWQDGARASVLPQSYQDLLEVAMDPGRPLRARGSRAPCSPSWSAPSPPETGPQHRCPAHSPSKVMAVLIGLGCCPLIRLAWLAMLTDAVAWVIGLLAAASRRTRHDYRHVASARPSSRDVRARRSPPGTVRPRRHAPAEQERTILPVEDYLSCGRSARTYR
jgi:hypothetical protein